MKRAVERNLVDATGALESLLAALPMLTFVEMVDVGARAKAIAKAAEELDKRVRDGIKEILGHEEGELLGETFKAINTLVPVTRCNVSALKEGNPKVYNKYLEDTTQERVSYEPR